MTSYARSWRQEQRRRFEERAIRAMYWVMTAAAAVALFAAVIFG